MANVKISQLPTWTGTAADLRWFVMDNSALSETFKFSGYSTPFRFSSTLNSIFQLNASNTVTGNYDFVTGYNNRILSTGGACSIVGSTDNTITAGSPGYAGLFGSYGCTINSNYGGGIYSTRNSTLGGYFAAMIGTNESTLTNGRTSIIAGGETQNLNGQWNGLFGGRNNTISNNAEYSAVLGGQYGVINNANFAAVVGGYDNNISGATNYSSIIGGYINVNQGNFSGIFSSRLSSILGSTTEYSTIIGSYSSKTSNDNAHIFGGLQNEIYASQGGIVLGRENKIDAGSDNSEMLGCRNSLIDSSSQDVTFVNTINTTSAGYSRITMLSTSGRTATTNDATFVENLVVFNYASLNYADDTAAAAGGVVLGQVYHNNGALRIRIV